MKNVKTGAVIYDTLTAPAGRTGRHVAMYLFTQGSNIYYMDQGGIKKGIYKSNGYITTAGSNPYKFDKFKNYNL